MTDAEQIGVPIWRMITDSQVRAATKGVQADLAKRGYYEEPPRS